MNSKFGKLISNDYVKGLAIAVITATLTVIYTAIPKVGIEGIDWNSVLQVGMTAGIGYLIKNLSTNSKGELGKKEGVI